VLGSRVRRHLLSIVQLLQVYCRLSELELAAGEKPRPSDVSLPVGTPERVTEWVAGEEDRVRRREGLGAKLSQAMQVHGYDSTPIREVMGGQGA
jgi:hypothetical protein